MAYYVVNTNTKNFWEDHIDMLLQGKAAIYLERKYHIEHLRKGDTVFLFHSGEGIVAYGKASGEVEKRDYHNDLNHTGDGEYFQSLSNFKHLQQPVTAAKMRDVTGSNFAFIATMFPVAEEAGRKLSAYITDNHAVNTHDAFDIIEALGDEMDIMESPEEAAWKAYLTSLAYAKLKAKGYIYEKDGHEFIKVWDNHNIPFKIHMRLAGIDDKMKEGSPGEFGCRRALDETRSSPA